MEIPNFIDVGVNSILYNVDPGEKSRLNSLSTIVPFNLQKEKAIENAIYLNDKWTINDIFSLNFGLRYSVYSKLGAGWVSNYIPNKSLLPVNISDSTYYKNNATIKNYQNVEPRLALKIQVDETSSLKLSYNKGSQYIMLISSTSVPSPDDVWKMADKYFKPVNSNHYALGYYKNFDENKIETSIEVYYKTLNNLVDYKNGAQLVMNNHIETETVNAKGKDYGIEFYVKKNFGTIDGWISYTLSKSLTKSNGIYSDEIINNNTYHPSAYDQPNDLTVLGTWHINRRLRISGNFTYSTGRPISLPELKYSFYEQTVVQYSDRGKYRLPDYHRLDLSISLDESLRIKKKWKGSWTFSLLNVYGRKNVYSVYYSKQAPSESNNYQIFGLNELYIIGRPLPTLTYNFIF